MLSKKVRFISKCILWLILSQSISIAQAKIDPKDRDLDGIADDKDNCPRHYNPDQADLDEDGQGNACDVDEDGDTIQASWHKVPFHEGMDAVGPPLSEDNCPLHYNPDQKDSDRDGIGDVCDTLIGKNTKDKAAGRGDTIEVVYEITRPVPGPFFGEKCNNEDDDGDGTTDEGCCYPGCCNVNVEICDGKDNNCDGKTDEEDAIGCIEVFLDQDYDGHGGMQGRSHGNLKYSVGGGHCLCPREIKRGWSLSHDDCNDIDSSINPSARELCDGVDNNCNGLLDEVSLGVSVCKNKRRLDKDP